MSKIDRTHRDATPRKLSARGCTPGAVKITTGAAAATAATAAAVAAREDAVSERERAADLRQAAADRRDQLADQREEAAREANDHTATQLREANEHLVVAAVHSQMMTEAAEHAKLLMSFKAERDFLTGLPNRALLGDRLAQSISLAKRHRKRVAVMYIDLDNFKDVNDSLGHSVGDLLLQSVARRLERCVRQSDTVSRQGGDEFVVLLSEIEAAADAARIAEKLLKTIAQPTLIGDHCLNVTVSIGISVYPDDGEDVESILNDADTAMYYAKRDGRGNYKRFSQDMKTHSFSRQSRSV